MASFDVFLDHERRLVRITAFGELFQPDGEEIITTARTKAAEHQYNVLYDIRQATTTVNLANWFNLPRRLEVFHERKTRQVKAAVLVSPTDKAMEGYKFYEVVTDNLGIKLRIFFDETEAIEWLNRQSNSGNSNINSNGDFL